MNNILILACGGALVAGSAALAAQSGTVLPTEWRLEPPTARVVASGTLPQGAVLTADRAHLAIVENGQAAPAVRFFRATTLEPERTVALAGATGTPLAGERGDDVWVSAGAGDALVHVDVTTGIVDRTIALPQPFYAGAIARSPDAQTFAVSGELANAVAFVDVARGTVSARVAVGRHPDGIAYAPDGKTLFVANWGESSVSAIDVATHAVRATIAVGKHPEALVFARDGRRLFVSESDDDSVGVIDAVAQRRVADVNVAPYAGRFYGASPSALALAPDGKRLFVALSAANAIAVLDVASATPRVVGALPTGWYPTAIVLEPGGTALDVVDGKGEGSRPNPQFEPFAHPRSNAGYVASETIGSIRRIAIPADDVLARGLLGVLADGGPNLRGAVLARGTAGAARPADSIVRSDGPIRHVIYVIKENRTYDQILGDVAGANGDPSLVVFGNNVTPNEHAIARRFGIFDNTFANAEVSADGHNWTVGAFANDYLERSWPAYYGGRRERYDFEDGADAATPHAGYLWDSAARAGISLRNYGEFTTALSMKPAPLIVSHMAGLARVTDPAFPGFDLGFSDLDREAEWAREFAAYVRDGTLPQLEIVRLPNDHTAGTSPGSRTPTAFVAENDLAVGRLVATVSHSARWKDTAIFIVEDDAQNGADHVDAQRMTAYVASAYAAGGVRHEHYSTAGVVRTIELLLGLPPLSSYDAAALPLDAAFTATPTQRPYDALPENASLDDKNTAHAYRAADSARLDFTHEDRVPDATLDDIVRHAGRLNDIVRETARVKNIPK